MQAARSLSVCLLTSLALSGCRQSTVSYESDTTARFRPPSPPPSLQISPPAINENPWLPSADARDWRHIVIHHTATGSGSVERIHESHLNKGWLGIGYHFLIGNGNGMADGSIEPTFRWRQQLHGAHAGKDEYNQRGIGICLVGNFEESAPSAAQLKAVKRLVAVLRKEYDIPSSRVIGHREVKATACPGKHFPLAEVSQSSVIPVYAQERRPDRVVVLQGTP